MAKRRYGTAATAAEGDTAQRVLDAAGDMIRAGEFHTATVDDLARRAGVGRATVFARFGSRLGILEALNERCAASRESEELHHAMGIDDPLEELAAVIPAGCRSWEAWGALHQHMRAIVVLEPEVRPLVEAQRSLHRAAIESLVGRLADRGLLREGFTPRRAAAAMFTLTGLETFIELRRGSGLTLDETIETVDALVRSLLRS